MLNLMKAKQARVIVRGPAMSDTDLMAALMVGKDHHVLVAMQEIGRRLELTLLEEAFDGKPEDRLRNLARMEGAREAIALVAEWRDKAEETAKRR